MWAPVTARAAVASLNRAISGAALELRFGEDGTLELDAASVADALDVPLVRHVERLVQLAEQQPAAQRRQRPRIRDVQPIRCEQRLLRRVHVPQLEVRRPQVVVRHRGPRALRWLQLRGDPRCGGLDARARGGGS